jgi:hypothetical protein
MNETQLMVMKAIGQAALGRQVYVVAASEQEIDRLRKMFLASGGRACKQNRSVHFQKGKVSFFEAGSHLVDLRERRIVGVPIPDTFFDRACFE